MTAQVLYRQRPLAIALMFGALGSTALALVVMPLVYTMVEKDRVEKVDGPGSM